MATTARKQWTFMVYMAGDNNLAAAGLADLREMKAVGTNDQLNVIAQFDNGADHKSRRYVLQGGTALAEDVVEELGETNCGDPEVFRSFIDWGVRSFPAERTMLVIWNHGNGWDDEDIYKAAARLQLGIERRGVALTNGSNGTLDRGQLRAVSSGRFRRALFSSAIEQAVTYRGIAYDDDACDFLDCVELKNVLAAAARSLGKKLDVVGMDACLMSMVEIVYQIREGAAHVVGSEQTEPNNGWPYDAILGTLAADPTMTPEALAETVVQKFVASYDPKAGVTQSAFDVSKVEALATLIDGLADVLVKNFDNPAVLSQVVQSRAQVQEYQKPDYVDLADFCELLAGRATLPAIKNACQDVFHEVRASRFVIGSEFRGASVQHSNGVSIYFPRKTVSPLYATLDFTKITSWEKFLAAYQAGTVHP